MIKVLRQLLERLLDCFHLHTLELRFQSMETPEAKAMRVAIEDIESEQKESWNHKAAIDGALEGLRELAEMIAETD